MITTILLLIILVADKNMHMVTRDPAYAKGFDLIFFYHLMVGPPVKVTFFKG